MKSKYNINTISDFKQFIESNKIKNRLDFSKRFSTVYRRFRKLLSTEEKDLLLPITDERWKKPRITGFIGIQSFIKSNNISSRAELGKHKAVYSKFLKLSKEEKNQLLRNKYHKYIDLNSFDDFKNFISDNKIKSRQDFTLRFQKASKRFYEILSKEEQELLIPSLKKKWDKPIPETIEEFISFVKSNNILNRAEFQLRFKAVYKKFKTFSLEDREKILPNQRDYKYRYEGVKTLEDLQKFIDENKVLGRIDLLNKYGTLHKRFSSELDKIKFKTSGKSYGENFIGELLKKNSISYVTEKTFSDLKDQSSLRYDFYLKDLNILIEYHGRQHFNNNIKSKYFSETLEKHDKMKYDYAIKHKIPIIYYTNERKFYKKYGYFTEVITDPKTLIERIKEIGLTNQSSINKET